VFANPEQFNTGKGFAHAPPIDHANDPAVADGGFDNVTDVPDSTDTIFA
jgi:hypothetical protein